MKELKLPYLLLSYSVGKTLSIEFLKKKSRLYVSLKMMVKVTIAQFLVFSANQISVERMEAIYLVKTFIHEHIIVNLYLLEKCSL